MNSFLSTIGISVFDEDYSYVRDCIFSALRQRSANIEVIARVDGIYLSNSRTIELLQEIECRESRIRVIYGEDNLGPYGSYKVIFREARGKYICQLDADDLLHQDAIRYTTAALEANKDLSFVYTDCLEIDPSGRLLRSGRRQHTPYSDTQSLVQFIPFHLRTIRKESYEQVGGYDQSLSCAGDYDISLKLAEVGGVKHVPLKLYKYRRHPGSMSERQRDKTIRESYVVAQRALRRRELDQKYRLILEDDGTTRLQLI